MVLILNFGDTLLALLLSKVIPTDELDLSLAHSAVDVDVGDGNVEWTMLLDIEPGVGLPCNVQDDQEGAGKVLLEEVLGVEILPIGITSSNREEGDVELGGQAHKVHDGADVRAVDAESGAEWEFFNAVTGAFPEISVSMYSGIGRRIDHIPCCSETNVGNSDTAVDEEGGETGQCQKPSENVAPSIDVQVEEGEAAEKELEEGDNQWTALLVNIGENLRAHTCHTY